MKFAKFFLTTAVVVSLLSSCFAPRSESGVEGEEVVEEPRQYGIVIGEYTLTRSKIKQGEAVGSILSRYGHSAREVYLLEQSAKGVFPLNKIRAGNSYTTFTRLDSLGRERLDHMVYESTVTNYAVFSFVGDSVSVRMGEKPVTAKRHKRSATIESSMWGAIMEADLPYALGSEIEDIYQWTVDFFSIKSGDCFTVIYDETFVDDTVSVGLGRIWGAKFQQGDQEHYAIPFKQGDRLQYWEADGGSLRKQMLKAPLKYSRISSGFSYSRLHPVHKVYKPHTGVDYAAPMGTPVHSVADGVITFCGWGGGGGNTLKVKHAGGFVTGYLHLKNFAKGVSKGATVKQGQTIGYVGSTGTSTGPHLDYRIWKGGQPLNPLKMPQTPAEPIATENRELFDYVKDRVIAELDGEVAESDQIRDLDHIVLPQQSDSVLVAQGRGGEVSTL